MIFKVISKYQEQRELNENVYEKLVLYNLFCDITET